MIALRIIIQNVPRRNPDFAKTYGSPRIPAPMIVPVSVNAVAMTVFLMTTSN